MCTHELEAGTGIWAGPVHLRDLMGHGESLYREVLILIKKKEDCPMEWECQDTGTSQHEGSEGLVLPRPQLGTP